MTRDGTDGTGTAAEDSSTSRDSGTDTGRTVAGDDLPVPGDGVPGDSGLCAAVAGWYGYATLAVLGASEDGGHVFPDDVVPLLQELMDAPRTHDDASADLLATAQDIADQTGEVIIEIRHGADAADALSELDQPMTLFADACSAAGVS